MEWESCMETIFYKQDGAQRLTTEVPTIACLTVIFQRLIFFAFYFAGIITVLLVIVAGIKFLVSGGDAKQIEDARKTITYAIIGLVVVLLSFAIISLIATVTGVECIREFGFGNCQ
jgi:hypothetical protein